MNTETYKNWKRVHSYNASSLPCYQRPAVQYRKPLLDCSGFLQEEDVL